MKRIVFILDRVIHYHKELLQTLESHLSDINTELYLLSGQSDKKELSRIRVESKVIYNELHFSYFELKVRNLTFRYQKNITVLIKEINPDIVIMSSHVGNISSWSLMRLKEKLNFKLISWQCGYEYNHLKIKNFLLRRFVNKFDYHLAYHTNAKKYALRYGAKMNQINVVHNTINEANIRVITKEVAKKQVEERLGIDLNNKDIILYVGAILEEKNLEQLCSSVEKLTSKTTLLFIVGDGPYLKELKDQFKNINNIIFIGSEYNDIGLYFDCADLFVLPGTGGLALNEAMAHRLPIITGYADGSADDLVIHNKNGLRLNTGTSTEITKAIITLLNSPETLMKMGNESHKMISSKYTYDKFIGRILSSLEALLN